MQAVSLCSSAALEYASFGWRVVPLHSVIEGRCSCGSKTCQKESRSRGKHPRVKDWQREASTDETRIGEWFERWPESNVGIQMGKSSGIIDFETDSDEGESKLLEVFGGPIPVTPMFSSGRGRHRLFRWHDDLPDIGTIPLGWGDIKLGGGGKGSQCVFPPSRHFSGKQYRWLIPPEACDVAEIPENVRNWIINGAEFDVEGKPRKTAAEWAEIAAGAADGMRNLTAVQFIGGMLRQWTNLETKASVALLYSSIQNWNAQCKPPLDDAELKRSFDSILRRELQRRVTEATDREISKSPEQVVAEITDAKQKASDETRTMKLVIVRSDPPLYELYAPQFSKARGGCLRLNAKQLCSFASIKVAALEQADYPLPDSFRKAWGKKGGIYEQLVFAAEYRDASAAEKRLATIAEYLLGQLSQAIASEEPNKRKPTKLGDGTIWFRWSEVWNDGLASGAVQREDARRLANVIGLRSGDFTQYPSHGGGKIRYCRFRREMMTELERLAEMDESQEMH